jgi:hypothetical protein
LPDAGLIGILTGTFMAGHLLFSHAEPDTKLMQQFLRPHTVMHWRILFKLRDGLPQLAGCPCDIAAGEVIQTDCCLYQPLVE